jgi:hypothetical protein
MSKQTFVDDDDLKFMYKIKKNIYSYSGISLHVTVVPRGTIEKKLNFFLIETIKAYKTLIFVRENVGALLKSI